MPQRRGYGAAVPALLAFWTGWAAAGQDLPHLIRGSRFIFAGTVERPGASNLSLLPADSGTVLVRVGEVLDVPDTMGDLRGQLVTLLLAEEGSARAGQEAIFFTNGWMFGENVAVREVAQIPDRDRQALRAAIAAERQKVRDEELAERMRSAVLVVAGQVLSVKPAAGKQSPPRSEHDPDWWEAEIAVASTIKGKAPGRTVTAYFPASLDERWLVVPKLREGQSAVFLLQPWEGQDLPAGALVILDPLDVQPEQQSERMRRLLR